MKNPHILTLLCITCLASLISLSPLFSQEEEVAPDKQGESTEPVESEEVTQQNEEALSLVREARSRLFQHQTVQADLSQLVSLGTYRFQSSGKYMAGDGFRTRIEYSVKLGNLAGEFLEVCDGQILHTRRQISNLQPNVDANQAPTVELARRDINKILQETQLFLDQPEAVRAAEIGIGGLPAILASLERMMIFDALEAKTTEEGRAVQVVSGKWNSDQQSKLAGGLEGLSAQIKQFLPDRVQITFAADTLFPEKFQYLKELPNRQGVYESLLTVAFNNAVINEPIPPHQFNYIPPPGMEERDETAMFIEAIKLAANPPQSEIRSFGN